MAEAMTDAQINRAIAEKLEPLPEDQAGFWKEDEYYGYSSPMRLWWAVYDDDTEDCAVTPSEFDKDPAAMVALIEAMRQKGYHLEVNNKWSPGDAFFIEKDNYFNGEGKNIMIAVRNAAAKALGRYGCAPWGTFAAHGRGGRLTVSPVSSDPFCGHCDLPADVDLTKSRVYLECDDPAPEAAAHVTVNGEFAGGFIGRPCRLEVTRFLKSGRNDFTLVPFAPKAVRLLIYRRTN